MVKLSKSALIRFKLDGKSTVAPEDWQNIELSATFDNDSVQPSIESTDFTFVNEGADAVRDWISKGVSGGVGIFEGIPFKIEAYNKDNNIIAFDGFLNLSNDFEDLTPVPRVRATLLKDNGLDSLENLLSGITCGYLESIGEITASDYTDINYQIIKKITILEVLIANIILFLLIKELAQAIKDTANAIAVAAADLAGGLSGPVGAAIYSTSYAILQFIYTASLVVAVIDLITKLINLLVPPLRTHKAIKVKTLMEIISTFLGYNFISPIKELDNLYYLPSNNNLEEQDTQTGLFTKINGTDQGIPNSQDYGYNCAELFELVKSLFNAKYVIIGNDLHLRCEGDPFWIKMSTYQMPPALLPVKQYNTNELNGDILLNFQTDITDEWTIDNYIGTSYEVKTDAIIVKNKKAKLIKGQNTINFNVALGSRKDELTAIENIMLGLARLADRATKVLGRGTNLAGQIKNKIGVLKQSQNNTTLPKLLYLNSDNKLPSDHRDKFSAKVLWNDYHSYKSFVDNNYIGQKIVYKDVRIPFGLDDFIKLTNNSYFRTFEGEQAKATAIRWSVSQDFALIDFYIRTPYTKNLKETKIEPS